MDKVTIIGAGIGGLTTAIALQQKGIDFEVFEAFPSFKPIGAGIILANTYTSFPLSIVRHIPKIK